MIDELIGCKNLLEEWYFKTEEKEIAVITLPYKGLDFFYDLFLKLKDKKILIISGEDKETGSVFEFIEKNNIKEDNIKVFDYKNSLDLKENFDLIILDDINSFPIHNNDDMVRLTQYIKIFTKKMILYSFENYTEFKNVIELPLNKDRGYLTEPRLLLSSLNIRNSLANTIYDYIDFFFNTRRNVIVYVNDDSIIESIYTHIRKINPRILNSIYILDRISREDFKDIAYSEFKASLFITKKMEDFKDIKTNFEFIVTEAFLEKYDYRQFFYICLRSNLYKNNQGEVLLVSKKETKDMKKCKELTFSLNKKIWES